ncbi:MAG TPA: hypothetical protein VHI93_04485, partial [Candidatus Thermoplasmatota archaeon]|nr:hypothetical protein [Candidatus Thermoplasmatota archaeon]
LGEGESRSHSFPWFLGGVARGSEDFEVDSANPQQKGQGSVLVTATSASQETTGRSPKPEFIRATRVELVPPTGNLALAADETRFFRIQVRNAGNVPEVVHLSVADSASGNNSRLEAEFLPARLEIPAERTAVTDLLVAYPFGGQETNFTANYTVRALVSYGPVLAKTPAILGRMCCPDRNYTFAAQAQVSEVVAGIGGTFRIPVRVANTAALGSGLNDTYRLLPELGGWPGEVDTPLLALATGESRMANLTVTVPATAVPGTATTLQVRVVPGHGAESVLPVLVRVEGSALAARAVHVDPSYLYLGDEARATVEVANTGTHDHTAESQVRVTVCSHRDGQPPLCHASDLPVPPVRAGRSVEIAAVLGSLADTAKRTVEAVWRTLDGQGGAPVQQEFRARQYAVVVFAPQTPFSGQPGEAVSYQASARAFKVANRGTEAEDLRLMAYSPAGQALLSGPSRIRLPAGANLSVPLQLVLPLPALGETAIPLTLSAMPASRPDRMVAASVTTSITDRLPPAIAPLPLPANWTVGQPLTVQARASDDSLVVAMGLERRQPPTNFTSQPLRQEGGLWTASIVFPASGRHEVRLVAFDAAGNVARSAVQVVQAANFTPPRLSLVEPLPEPATPDTVLRVQVAGERALASLAAWVEGGNRTSLALADGVAQVRLADLAGLRPGLQNVTVDAVDTAGAHAALTISVRVQGGAEAPQASSTTTRPAPALPLAALLLAFATLALRRGRPGAVG